jgi:predicted ArsR family transcriptional regulator
MIQTLRLSDFTNAFRNSDRAEQFSYEALELIFDYIEQYEDDTGEQIEFDMIALCCEWAEEDAATLAQYYDFDSAELDDVAEAMRDATQVAGVTSKGTVVYVQF